MIAGEQIALVPPRREEFVARWDRYNDAATAMSVAFQTAGAAAIFNPPVTREQRAALWDYIVDGLLVAFDVRAAADGRLLGEAGISRLAWPQASGDVAVALFDPADRGHGHGTEAVLLLLAYGFDALGLHRMMVRYLSVNEAVVHAVERNAAAVGGRLVGIEREAEWAYGAPRDRIVVEVLAADFPAHPATAHLRR